MRRKTITQLFLASCMLFSLNSCFPEYNTYGIEGIPAVSNDGKYIACVVAESEATSHQENGGFIKTTYSTSYWLKQFETATGKFLKKKKLLGDTDNPDIGCYGSFDSKIWLYVNGIQAYDINSLEKLTDEQKMAADNGVKKTLFPYGSRFVNAAVENGYIDFTADNSEQYRLSLASFKITNKKEIQGNENEQEKKIRRLLNADDYGTRCDTLVNKAYMLAKDSNAAANTSVTNYSVKEAAYRMKLFTTNYTIRKLGAHNSFTYQNINQLSENTFLNPCFAKDTYRDAVMHLSKPDGLLLIHQDVLGEKSKAIITRIDTNGKKVWETITGVSTKISNCVMSGKYFIITTNKDYMFSPHIGKDALCIVDMETGRIIKPSLSL